MDFSGKYAQEDNIRHRSNIMTASTNLYTGEGNKSRGLLLPPTRNDNRLLIPLIRNVTSQLHRKIQKVNSCKPPSFLKGNSYLYLRLYLEVFPIELHSLRIHIQLGKAQLLGLRRYEQTDLNLTLPYPTMGNLYSLIREIALATLNT